MKSFKGCNQVDESLLPNEAKKIISKITPLKGTVEDEVSGYFEFYSKS